MPHNPITVPRTFNPPNGYFIDVFFYGLKDIPPKRWLVQKKDYRAIPLIYDDAAPLPTLEQIHEHFKVEIPQDETTLPDEI